MPVEPVLDRVDDPAAWWRDVRRRWLRRCALREPPITLNAYAEKVAMTQWVHLPPRPVRVASIPALTGLKDPALWS